MFPRRGRHTVVEALRLEGYDNTTANQQQRQPPLVVEALRLEGYDNFRE